MGCKGDMEGPPLRRSSPGGQLSELLCTQDSTAPLETSWWQCPGASRAPRGTGSAAEPGVQFCSTLGDRSLILIGCQQGVGPLHSLEVTRRIPGPGSLPLSSCFMNLWRGSRSFGTEVEGVFALSQVLSEMPHGSTGPSSPAG